LSAVPQYHSPFGGWRALAGKFCVPWGKLVGGSVKFSCPPRQIWLPFNQVKGRRKIQ